MAVVDLAVVAPLIHEAVAVGPTEAVGPAFGAEAVLVVVVGNRGGN